MISAVCFSKDRPAQLDLCLRSTRAHLPALERIAVIWKASSPDYRDGYHLCETRHPRAIFVEERDFRTQTLELLAAASTEHATFLCDDDIAYRPADLRIAEQTLNNNPDALCFSLRLGRNTSACYSLALPQRFPAGTLEVGRPEHRVLLWEWADAEADLGYPGSCDGHVFRREQLLRLVSARASWSGPNELEDALNGACQTALLPLLASFHESALVNVPANRVQTTHRTNRFGERFHSDPRVLNDWFLKGARLALDVDAAVVDAAHVEMPLKWAA